MIATSKYDADLKNRIINLENKVEMLYSLLYKNYDETNLTNIESKIWENKKKELNLFMDLYCSIIKINKKSLKSNKKSGYLPRYRRIFCKLVRNNINCTLEEIGKTINKTHGTVIHHLAKIKSMPEEILLVQNIQNQINNAKKL